MIPNVSNTFVTTTDAAAAEKAVCITPLDENHFPASGFVVVSGQLNVTPGTSTTAVVLKIRQGSGTSGTAVATLTHTLAATDKGQIGFTVVDTDPIAGGQYTLTVTQTSGAAAGTVNDALVMSQYYPEG